MDRCTGSRDIHEMLFKMALNTIQLLFIFILDHKVGKGFFQALHFSREGTDIRKCVVYIIRLFNPFPNTPL